MIKDGVPSFWVDNQGMYSIVEHLVISHNIKRPLFISGPKGHYESEIRLKAYLDVLKKYSIENSSDISYGDFSASGGAISKYIKNNVLFDAVVSVDDDTAIGVIDRLKSLNYSVPQDIIVTGFDDVEYTNYEESLKLYRDLKNTIDTAFSDGKLEGIEQGIEQERAKQDVLFTH